jgi:hypothetical protein
MRLPLILVAAGFLAFSQPADRPDQHGRKSAAVMVSIGVTLTIAFAGAAFAMQKPRPATRKK